MVQNANSQSMLTPLIDTIGYDPSTFFQWYLITKRIQDYITITATMQFTFFVSDFGPSFNITEAAIDHFYIAEANELSVEDLTTRFSIYPNPAKNQIVVSGLDQLSNLEIYTISGAKVASYLVSNESQLDLNLPSGIYLVKITSDTLSTTKKLIIN